MENIADIRFAEMMTTKFCHDITGPIGAVNNGVEFLLEGDVDMRPQAESLIANSAAEAMVRLMFYRQAYGVNTSDSAVSLNETRKVVVNFFNQAKSELVWPVEYAEISGLELTSLQRKIVMNLMIIAIGALPKGGIVSFVIGASSFSVVATGDAIKFGEMEAAFLGGEKKIAEVDPRSVQIFYTYRLIAVSGKKFSIDSGANSITFKVEM